MKVWANPDGKNMRAELYTRPVQLKNPASGAWEPIDTRIVTRDGKLQATRVKTPLTFGGRGTKQLVSADGKQGKSGLNVTQALPEPKISGSTVTYPNAVALGADLVVQAQADGFISQVVFRQRPTGPVTIRLPLTLPEGTTFGKTSQGLPQLKDAKGRAAAAPIVLTAMDAKMEASPEEGKSSPVTASVETSGTTSKLVFTPDEKFLADPAVTYPVTIAAADDWFGGGTPTDAWVSKNSPGTNNAAAGWLRAGTTSTSADIARVYLKFNTEDPALEGATVVDADLWVWNYKSGGPNGQLCGENLGSGIAAARVTSSWSTSSLSWSSQPSVSSSMEGGNKAGYNYEADPASWCAKEEQLVHRVTGMARAWIEQDVPNHGVVLRAVTETAAINWRQYYSSENSGELYPGYRHPPTLMVQYTPAPKPEVMRFYYEGEPEPQTAEEWEAFMNDPERSRGYPEMLPPQDITEEQLLQELKALNTKSSVSTTDLHDDTPPESGNWLKEYESTDPPTVVAAGPDEDARGVPPNTEIWVVFSKRVIGAEMALEGPGGEPVAGVSRQENEKITQFLPERPLTAYTHYSVTAIGAQDVAGQVMPGPHRWSFTTGGPDTDPPTVEGSDPAEDETNVPVDTAVRIGFDEGASDVQITVKDSSNATVQGTTAGDNAEWTFTPTSPLAASTVYQVEVSGAKDRSGNVMTPYTWSFTTAGDT
ncbi:Ig-like domain-containing protein [Nonomuraea purpurea]|uniref:Ig-like domain-containing protein n=1 Tax=Nonomuraea purpurea TaxID=1849276 RepID=A0ABV8G7U5_9ACTN